MAHELVRLSFFASACLKQRSSSLLFPSRYSLMSRRWAFGSLFFPFSLPMVWRDWERRLPFFSYLRQGYFFFPFLRLSIVSQMAR